MKTRNFFSAAGLLFLLAVVFMPACAKQGTTVSYSPMTLQSGSGNLNIETFKYIPAEQGKLKPNQIKNTALGSIKLDTNVADYVTRAIWAEFKLAGYNVGDGNITLSADIEKFLADDLGYSIDWELAVNYAFLNKKSGNVVFSKSINIKQKSEKFGLGVLNAMNKVIASSFEELITDPEVKTLLSKSSPGKGK